MPHNIFVLEIIIFRLIDTIFLFSDCCNIDKTRGRTSYTKVRMRIITQNYYENNF